MYDVIIVGGGPSGSHAAYHCALKGLSTLLIERERFPRDKPCGGAVDAEMRDRIGSGLEPFIEARTSWSRHFFNYHEILQLRYENIYITRAAFDNMLLRRAESAGAEVLEGVKVSKVAAWSGGAEVVCETGSYKGRIVIGADGVGSVVRRCAGLDAFRVRPDRYLAAVLEPEASAERRNELLGSSGDKSFYNSYFFGGFIGLGWVFPKRSRLSIGLGGLAESAAGLQLKLAELLRALGFEADLARRARWHMIPSRPLRRIYSTRTLLVGDAAGFVNPLTGAGIDTGMVSAELAARVCEEACEEGDFSSSFLARYQAFCAPLLRRMRGGARLVALARYLVSNKLYSDGSMEFLIKRLAPLVAHRERAHSCA